MNKPLSKEDLDGLDQETLVETVLSLQKSLDEVLKNNELLLEALKVSRQRSYGSKSEVSSSQIPLDLFLNEAEDLSDNTVEEVKLSSAAPRKVKVKGKKKSDLSKITDHREELIELPKEKLDQIFTEGNYRRLPDQIVQKLEHYPARFEAVTYRVCVYCARLSLRSLQPNTPTACLYTDKRRPLNRTISSSIGKTWPTGSFLPTIDTFPS